MGTIWLWQCQDQSPLSFRSACASPPLLQSPYAYVVRTLDLTVRRSIERDSGISSFDWGYLPETNPCNWRGDKHSESHSLTLSSLRVRMYELLGATYEWFDDCETTFLSWCATNKRICVGALRRRLTYALRSTPTSIGLATWQVVYSACRTVKSRLGQERRATRTYIQIRSVLICCELCSLIIGRVRYVDKFRMYVFLALRSENTLEFTHESVTRGLPIAMAFPYRLFVRMQCLAWEVLFKFGAYVSDWQIQVHEAMG